ncbi:uncharacterized protein Z518_09290 [Rhinocladiella mackenziei CBS 650.93]|uniref:Myb-like domain-containing protein n=1 Tax=Rhinocladiella mackenziei CBS 650.93 TaxID=1442369 RepID=A0A0D2I6X9_9EURO|nr:uncharacterized protein Z518_09290 [Rhinocladiella mackenziei CBS 650.93]KIX01564.1 hypothetical protein Z518_09290 [Rhinocladiella mackenziei CBS 650.93]
MPTPAYRSYGRPPDYWTEVPAWPVSQPASTNHGMPNGVGPSSTLTCSSNHPNMSHSADAGTRQTSPILHWPCEFMNPSCDQEISILSPDSANHQNVSTISSPIFRGEKNSERPPSHLPNNLPANPHRRNQNMITSSSIPQNFSNNESGMVCPDDTLLEDNAATLGNWTTPNTLLEAVTPIFNEQLLSPAVSYREDEFGALLPANDLPGFQPDPDFDLFELHPDFVPPEQYSLHPTPGYAPLPEWDIPVENRLQSLTNPLVHSSSLCQHSFSHQQGESWPLVGAGGHVQSLWATPLPVDVPSSRQGVAPGASNKQWGGRSGQRDTSKDDFLVQCKSQGMSYKQIKELGAFDEAESTLRGRYRVLTKPKEARLRKPEWGEREIQLLFEGVSQCSKSNPDAGRQSAELDAVSIGQFVSKVPWKQVAEFMERRGAYRYGNATAKKKYLELLKARGIPVSVSRNEAGNVGNDMTSTEIVNEQVPQV